MEVLPFDQGPPKVLVPSCSSLECLPFDHGPDQVLMLCHVNENLTLNIIHSNIHLACDSNSKNMHLEPLNPVVIKSLWKTFQDLSSTLLDHVKTNAPMKNSNDNVDASTMDIIDLQDLLWNPSNVNDDSIFMNNLCCLLSELPFDGCSVVCDPKCHTGHLDDCLDHGKERREHCIERTEHCVASILVKLGYASCSYALAGIHNDFTHIPHTVPFLVPSLTTDTSIAMSINPTFIATSTDVSTNNMTVGDYAPMSSMSPMVQVSNERVKELLCSLDFGCD